MKQLSSLQFALLTYLYVGNQVFICRDPRTKGHISSGLDLFPHKVSKRSFAKLKSLGLTSELSVRFHDVEWGQVVLTDQGSQLVREVFYALC
ncbi:hypothetical protein SAMN04488540_11719 [Ferrimonas sediminum]|uniref:Uncharacterized protein n=1 Tax=Ferrimonas sediminum TaxID=718193 RepID=A0A1G8YAV5_9GAMM|nr:hypothetical protein SAMN04488540_11719 [Ferrimonas sediminum]